MIKRVAFLMAVIVSSSLFAATPSGAAFPGANGKIAYSLEGLRLMTPNGLDSERLPLESGGTDPEISPDGTRILAVVGQSLRSYRMDGTDERILSGGVPFQSDRYYSPTWSPDGSRIAFGLDAVDNSLDGTWIVDADGSDEQRVYTDVFNDFEWSPTADVFVYARGGIFTVPIGSTTSTRVTSGLYDYAPNWSPAGDQILFASEDDSDEVKTVIVDVDGGNRQVVVDNGGAAVWSPDGTKIAYYIAASCCSGFYIVNLATGAVTETKVRVYGTQIQFDWGPCASGVDCNSAPLSEHPRTLTLQLSSHLLAKGTVQGKVGYGYNCESKVKVKIQRKKGRRWTTVLTTSTNASGSYGIALPDVVGKYRAALPEVEKGRDKTETCLAETSAVRSHAH